MTLSWTRREKREQSGGRKEFGKKNEKKKSGRMTAKIVGLIE